MFVIIIGGGKMGGYLGRLLLNSDKKIRIIEERSDVISLLQRDIPADAIIHGNATDLSVLEEAGIRQADAVAAVTGTDETNLVVAGLARSEYGVIRTIARVNDPQKKWMFTAQMGVDVALNQADLMAHLIVEEMPVGEMVTLLKLRKGEYSLVEEKVAHGSQAVGNDLKTLQLPRESVVAAVIRKGRLLIPRGDLALEEGDEVLAVVHSREIGQLAAILGSDKTS